jgi:hypothetical protein
MTTDLNSSEKITCTNFSIQVLEPGYYEIFVNENVDFSADDFQKLLESQKKLGGEQLPVLILCSDNVSTDIELLKSLSKNANNPFTKADAFVISSIAQRILGNFYIKISKPERPTKLFNDKTEALAWLKQFF